MPRRTTVILEDDVYEKLVEESVKRNRTARAISRVLNELLREAFRARKELLELIYSEKLVYIDEEEFEETRRELSERLAAR